MTLNVKCISAAEILVEDEHYRHFLSVDAAKKLIDDLTAAEADAKAVQLRGEAEASAIKAKSAALASNPALISLTQAERWNGQLPTTMVPGGAVPFLNVGQ